MKHNVTEDEKLQQPGDSLFLSEVFYHRAKANRFDGSFIPEEAPQGLRRNKKGCQSLNFHIIIVLEILQLLHNKQFARLLKDLGKSHSTVVFSLCHINTC